MKTKLRSDYEKACNAYLKAFCGKHGYDYGDAVRSWVGGDVGGVTECGDLSVSLDDIITDIDRDAPEDESGKYYDYCLRVGSIACGGISTPDYRSWLAGCPRMDEERIARLEELQQDIRKAERELEEQIRKEKTTQS